MLAAHARESQQNSLLKIENKCLLREIVPRVSTRCQISLLIVNFSAKSVEKFW